MPAKFIIHRASQLNHLSNLTDHLPDPVCTEFYTDSMMERLKDIILHDADPDHAAFHKKNEIRGILPVEKYLDCMCVADDQILYSKAFGDYGLIEYKEVFNVVDSFPIFYEVWGFKTDQDCFQFVKQYMSDEWVKHKNIEEFNTQNLVTQSYEYVDSLGNSFSKKCNTNDYLWDLTTIKNNNHQQV